MEKKDTLPQEDTNEQIEFVPKICPTCNELLSVRKLGVWGYYCTECMFWWGTYDPWPKVRKQEAPPPKKK